VSTSEQGRVTHGVPAPVVMMRAVTLTLTAFTLVHVTTPEFVTLMTLIATLGHGTSQTLESFIVTHV